MKVKSTKRALLISGLALLLCVSMLVGSTFAWFSDSVTSKNNIIKAGNLDIELQYKALDKTTGELMTDWATVDSTTKLFSEETLWEPGYTEVVYLKLVNAGTLALNYQVGINIEEEIAGTNVAGEEFNLSEYIEFDVIEGQKDAFESRAAAVAAAEADSRKLNAGYVKGNALLETDDEAYMALVVYMPETVGNEANHNGTDVPEITFGVNVIATQKTHESDSFGNDYDALAQGGSASGAAPAEGTWVQYDVWATGSGGAGTKVAAMVIHSDSVEDADAPISISVVPTDLDENFTVAAGQEANAFEISVTNLKAGNTKPIKVTLQVGTGLTGVKVYHKNDEITGINYNSDTGYVEFNTTSFSPYTVVFDAVAEEEEPKEETLPVAKVTDVSEEFANTTLEWQNYGPANAQAEQQLEAAFVFETPHTSATVQDSIYKDWLCDFYVSVDRDVPDNAIFLGGNYGDWGWIGFSNDDLPVDANEEVPLLGTALGVQSNWTYEGIVNLVSTFKCGVARTYGEDMETLAGATFTVKLCLINPETNERTAVNTVTYTFPANQ